MLKYPISGCEPGGLQLLRDLGYRMGRYDREARGDDDVGLSGDARGDDDSVPSRDARGDGMRLSSDTLEAAGSERLYSRKLRVDMALTGKQSEALGF
jgi:hypothetical protein